MDKGRDSTSTDDATGAVITQDVTEDVLSLGVTEETDTVFGTSGCTAVNNGTATSPTANILATTAQAASTSADSRSVINLQRFAIPGSVTIPTSSPTAYSSDGGAYNYVRRFTSADSSKIANGCPTTGALPRCTADDAISDNQQQKLRAFEACGVGRRRRVSN